MDYLKRFDPIEIIFAFAICAAGVCATINGDQSTISFCLGAAATYIKGKTTSVPN
jgi:hypothetical protein